MEYILANLLQLPVLPLKHSIGSGTDVQSSITCRKQESGVFHVRGVRARIRQWRKLRSVEAVEMMPGPYPEVAIFCLGNALWGRFQSAFPDPPGNMRVLGDCSSGIQAKALQASR
jgi:hypothetical protein